MRKTRHKQPLRRTWQVANMNGQKNAKILKTKKKEYAKIRGGDRTAARLHA